MICYIDSNILLSLLFREKSYDLSLNIWKKYPEKITSSITISECYNNFHKMKSNILKNKEEWIIETRDLLDKLLTELNIREYNEGVINIIKSNENICKARTLDAIHLATALLLHLNIAGNIILASYDKNVNKIAKQIGMATEIPYEYFI